MGKKIKKDFKAEKRENKRRIDKAKRWLKFYNCTYFQSNILENNVLYSERDIVNSCKYLASGLEREAMDVFRIIHIFYDIKQNKYFTTYRDEISFAKSCGCIAANICTYDIKFTFKDYFINELIDKLKRNGDVKIKEIIKDSFREKVRSFLF